MAANFWESKWAQTAASKHRLLETQMDDRARGLTEDQIQLIKVHFAASISDFVKQYKLAYKVDLRQRVAATASVYFRRFYLKNCFCHVDPRLVFVGCIYLASKVEESQLQAKHLVTFMRKYRPNWNYDMKHILDMEMILMEDLNFNLVVFSPYRSLAMYLRDVGIGDVVGLRAWTILNDSYRTDVSLLHPPHMIALACIQLAAAHAAAPSGTVSVQQPAPQTGPEPDASLSLHPTALQAEQALGRLVDWLADLNVDLNRVYDIVVDITVMYERYSTPIGVEECNRLLDAIQGVSSGQAMQAPAAVFRR